MVCVQPERLGNRCLQLQLDLKNVLARREARPVAHAKDVRVDCERLLAECRVENDVGGLAADSWQLLQLLAGPRDLASVLTDQVF